MNLFDIFGGGGSEASGVSISDLTPQERKRALNMALMQAGAGILANNTGHYGAFAPAAGPGLQAGLLGYTYNIEKAQKEAEKRRKAEAQKKVISSALIPGQAEVPAVPASQAVPARYKANNREFNNMQEAEEYIKATDPRQDLGAALYGEFGGKEVFPNGMDFSQYADAPMMSPDFAPRMQVDTLPGVPGNPGNPGMPASPTRFDPNLFLINALQNPEAGYTDVVLKAMLEKQGGDSPFGKVMPHNYTPESLAEFARTNDFSKLKPILSGAGMGNVNPGQFTPESLAIYSQTQNYGDLVPLRAPIRVDAGNEILVIDSVSQQVIGRYSKTLSPGEAASDAARQREQAYTLPAPQPKQAKPQTFSVTDPNGGVHTFPSKEAADKFKRAIGGR